MKLKKSNSVLFCFQRCKDFLIQRHLLYNTNENTEEKEQKVNDEYVKDLKGILEVDDELYINLEKEIGKKSEYIRKQKNEIEDLVSNTEVRLFSYYNLGKRPASSWYAEGLLYGPGIADYSVIAVNLQ